MSLSHVLIVVILVTCLSDVDGRSVNVTKFNGNAVRIGAFNIKTFGKAKMSDPVVANRIVDIVAQYDMILIQEIRDISMESVVDLFDMLNQRVPMNYIISDRLGRTSYKEQYAFFYNTDVFRIVNDYLFDDVTAGDIYEREPYSVLVSHISTGFEMVLIGLHAKPDDAVIEIQDLEKVYHEVETALGSSNIVILGDLNAGCSYASVSELETTYVFSDPKFLSLISHSADTTVSNTVCPYDRIIVSGSTLSAMVTASVVHRFDLEFSMSQEEALDVSDHYPVEMTLQM